MVTNFGTKIAISYEGGLSRCRQGNRFWLSIYGVHIGATWRIWLNRWCAAAMQPYVKLLWPLVIVHFNSQCRVTVAHAPLNESRGWGQVKFANWVIFHAKIPSITCCRHSALLSRFFAACTSRLGILTRESPQLANHVRQCRTCAAI